MPQEQGLERGRGWVPKCLACDLGKAGVHFDPMQASALSRFEKTCVEVMGWLLLKPVYTVGRNGHMDIREGPQGSSSSKASCRKTRALPLNPGRSKGTVLSTWSTPLPAWAGLGYFTSPRFSPTRAGAGVGVCVVGELPLPAPSLLLPFLWIIEKPQDLALLPRTLSSLH